jgi:uncharacterized HNH endonuclease L245
MKNITLNDYKEFRTIPDYPDYSINRFGTIRNDLTGAYISSCLINQGYYICWLTDKENKNISKHQELVHRLVAITWLPTPKDKKKIEINHIDGNKQNNHVSNLEWVTKVENAEHANKYLRYQNGKKLKCWTRNFETGEVLEHESIAAASKYMGFNSTLNIMQVTPKSFGKLLADKFEVRIEGDTRPWFYENRKEKVLSRYRLEIVYPDGSVKEFFDPIPVIKLFRIYGQESRGIHAIAKYIETKYPQYKVRLEDAYDIQPVVVIPADKRDRKPIYMVADEFILIVKSLRAAAELLHADRAILTRKIDTLEVVKGFVLIQDDLDLINLYRLRDKFLDQDTTKPDPSIIKNLFENSI